MTQSGWDQLQFEHERIWFEQLSNTEQQALMRPSPKLIDDGITFDDVIKNMALAKTQKQGI